MGAVDINIDEINAEIARQAKEQGLDIGEQPVAGSAVEESPRDAKGRFTKRQQLSTSADESTQEDVQADETVVEPEQSVTSGQEETQDEQEVIYEKTVTINGRQMTFQGATPEEVMDKFAIALEAAGPLPVAKEEPKKPVQPALTADELFTLGQRLQRGEPEAIEEYLSKNPAVVEKALGVTRDQMQEMLAERVNARETNTWQRATDEFRAAHPEYVTSDKNRDLIGAHMIANRMPPSASSIEAAYQHLTRLGALDVQQDDEPRPVVAQTAVAPKKRPAAGSSLFGTGQTGGQRTAKVSSGNLEARIVRAQQEMSSSEFIDFINSDEVQAWLQQQ